MINRSRGGRPRSFSMDDLPSTSDFSSAASFGGVPHRQANNDKIESGMEPFGALKEALAADKTSNKGTKDPIKPEANLAMEINNEDLESVRSMARFAREMQDEKRKVGGHNS